jgi:ribonuclease T2
MGAAVDLAGEGRDEMRFACRVALVCLPALVLLGLVGPARAQHKGEPDKFDFYLLNLSWSPEFCAIQGTSPQCAAHPGFVVHGLWPQNYDGSYPVFCSERAGPASPEKNLDITPDASLLQHEWSKHGTCTTLPPDEFFALEHKAFHAVTVPTFFTSLDHEVLLKPVEILDMFAKANPSFPKGSVVLSCGNNRLTAIEVCMAKDGLQPIACQGLRECHAQVVRITPPGAK